MRKTPRSFLIGLFISFIMLHTLLPIVHATGSLKLTVISDTISGDGYDISVDTDSEVCYLSTGYQGVRRFNISDYENPVLQHHITEQNNGYAHQLLQINSTIYVGDGYAGLTVINWTIPDSPQVLNRTTGQYGWSMAVDDENKTLFFASGSSYHGIDEYLVIFNITEIGQLELISELAMPGTCTDVEFASNIVYLTEGDVPLVSIDVSNRSNPVELDRAETNPDDSFGTEVEVVGDYAYVASWHGPFQIFDISDPANLILVKEIDEYSDGTGIDSYGNYVYFVDERDGLIVFDISTPGDPKLKGKYTDSRIPYRVEVVEEYIFLTHSQGFTILQQNPRIIPGYNVWVLITSILGVLIVVSVYFRKRMKK